MASSTSPLNGPSTSEADTKISNDLRVLREKMDLLETLLDPLDASAPRLSVRTDDAVRSVAGYLDACGPRMIELVTACTASHAGVLSEDVFGEVLGCNDRLQKLLADFDTRLVTETEASTTVASAASASASASASTSASASASASASDPNANVDLTEQFGDLLLGNEDPFARAHGSGSNLAGAKTTGEDDDSNSNRNTKPPAAAAPKPPERDPFDDFFAERTEGSGF